MKSLIEFDNEQQFQNYLNEKEIWSNFLGAGSEVSCYLSKNDNNVYKIRHSLENLIWNINNINSYKTPVDYFFLNPNKIIMQQEVNLNSFYFPTTLFTHNNQLLGYISRYAPENIFSRQNTKDIELLKTLDFSKILNAYYNFLPDLETLSQNNIEIVDMPFNLVFDGNNFYVIDTWWYCRNTENTLSSNVEQLKYSIISVFEAWTRQYRYSTNFQYTTTEEYLKDIEKDCSKIKKLYL